MKLKFSDFREKSQTISEEIDISTIDITNLFSLVKVESCQVEATIKKLGNLFEVHLKGVAKVILECAYSLEHFPKTLRFSDDLLFSRFEEEIDDLIVVPNGNYDLTDHIHALIRLAVPLRAIKKGAKLPSGDGYRVYSEDDREMQAQASADRWAELDNFFDDEE